MLDGQYIVYSLHPVANLALLIQTVKDTLSGICWFVGLDVESIRNDLGGLFAGW